MAEQVPDEHLAVVAARGKRSTPQGRPLDTVERALVAAQLQQGLARLPDIENSDDVRVHRKGRQQVVIVRGGGQSQQWRRMRHGLLGERGADATTIGICVVLLAE